MTPKQKNQLWKQRLQSVIDLIDSRPEQGTLQIGIQAACLAAEGMQIMTGERCEYRIVASNSLKFVSSGYEEEH